MSDTDRSSTGPTRPSTTYNPAEHLADMLLSASDSFLVSRKDTATYLQNTYAANLAFEQAVQVAIEAEQERRASEKGSQQVAER